jgi:MFS family permease
MADRYDRKQQLVWAQVINAMLNVLLGVLVITRLIDPWHIYATGILASMVQVFQQPARQSLTPESVDRRRLTNAIGLNSIVFNVSRSLGPAIAGLVIAAVGAGGSYLIQGGIYLLTTVWTVQIGLPGRATRSTQSHQRDGGGLLSSIGVGWRYIWQHETIRAVIIVSFASSLFGMPLIALLPVFAKDVLAVGPQGQGLLLTGMGIGGLAAAFLIASIGDRLPRGQLMLAGLVTYGLALLAFSTSHWFPLSVTMMIVIGLCNVSANALVQTVIQAAAASDMRGRVNSMFQQGQVLTTLGSLLAGTLAELWSPQSTVILLGIATITSGLAIFTFIPRLRTLR